MQTLRILKNVGKYKTDDIVVVSNNEAHALIDTGAAVLNSQYIVPTPPKKIKKTPKKRAKKMMRAGRSKKYSIK